MNSDKKLSKESIRALIEGKLCTLVKAAIEGEYNIDRLNNLVYKEGGRKRAVNKIKELLKQWEEEYDLAQSEIIEVLKNSFQYISPSGKKEANEVMSILSEIEVEEEVDKDIREGNIEKYERDI